MDSKCGGVVECTALALAESCVELDGRLTLFGILDELQPREDGEVSFVVYAKFEGCEHAGGRERSARILVSDEEGEVLAESPEYPVFLDGTKEPVTVIPAFDLPEDLEGGDRLLWVEAVLDEEVLSQTAVRLRQRFNV